MTSSRLGGMPFDSNENCALTALCWNPKHTSSSESYYQTSYNFEKIVTEKLVFIVNINDQVESILPSMRHNKLRSKMWICD